ncbi:RNA polymerase sigma factor [Roseiconus nitratireducens]|nr:sigma-70 family RNA polymerase sigma factor [Roseiconus nitratireducens]
MKRPHVPSSENPVAGNSRTTSLSLLRQMELGEPASWNRFSQLYGPLVYSWCRQFGLSRDDAADVSQDVFQIVSQKLEQFAKKRPEDSFRKWLKTVCLNRCRDHIRRDQKRPIAWGGTTALHRIHSVPDDHGEEIDLPADTSEQEQEALEKNYLLRRAAELVREQFEATTWQAFWQTAVQGRNASDVAADLGISANAVRVAKSRVRSRLREELTELID